LSRKPLIIPPNNDQKDQNGRNSDHAIDYLNHSIDSQGPGREFSFGDGVVQVADRKVRIVFGHVVGGFPIKVLDPLVRLEVELSNF
jgi:hypothetical protein